jgi:preprotein translocase subunit SecE
MARASDNASFLSELGSSSLYKRNQGRLTRQLTAIAVIAIIVGGAWRMATTILSDYERPVRLGIPFAIAAVGVWVAYRLVNYPRFADFLISVEAEMSKVSWPDRTYLVRATGVVLTVMVILGAYLAVWDLLWFQFFDFIGFLDLEALKGE